MRVKWSNVALLALIITGILLWKHPPTLLESPQIKLPQEDIGILTWWALLLVTVVAVARIARK